MRLLMPKNANSKIGQSELRPRILDFCSEVVETSEGDRQKGEPDRDTKFSIFCETSSKIARKSRHFWFSMFLRFFCSCSHLFRLLHSLFEDVVLVLCLSGMWPRQPPDRRLWVLRFTPSSAVICEAYCRSEEKLQRAK